MPINCSACGEPLDNVVDPPDGRSPCPKCGSTRRLLSESIHAHMNFAEYHSTEHERSGEIIGFSESLREGLATYGSQEDSGELRFGLKGMPPQGERDTVRVCVTLIQRLNRDGADWGEPIASQSNDDVDCRSTRQSNPSEHLCIQVVRAVVDPELWKRLRMSGTVDESRPVRVLAAHLRDAIDHKQRQIPLDRRGKLILALDATRLSAHAMQATVKCFRGEYGAWAGGLGFRAIWLVGPPTSESLTSRLC